MHVETCVRVLFCVNLHGDGYKLVEFCLVLCSSKRAVDESEREAAERRSLRCVWVAGGRALTEQEAAAAIVSEARRLLQEDLAQLGVQWDPATLAPAAPALHTPDDSSSGADSPSASYLQPQQEQRDGDANPQKRDEFKTSANGDARGSRTNGRGECVQERRERAGGTKTERGRYEAGGGAEMQNLEEMKEDLTEPSIKPMHHNEKLEIFQESDKGDANKDSMAGDKEPQENSKERSKQEGQKSKEIVSVRPEDRQANVPPRSLTQELSEVLASPFSQPKALPQPSPTPRPPPRFRAPTSRAEEPRRCPSPTSKGEGSASLVASPVQPGRLRHSRALSKVLNSIRTDKQLQDDTRAARTSRSDSAAEAPPGVSTPANVDKRDSHQSASPGSAHSSSPEAKRRRVDGRGRGRDDFSSPELFAENEKGENDEEAVRKAEGESFGDSFELDTQTEKLIVQQTSQRRGDNHQGVDQMAVAEKTPEEEDEAAAVVTADLEKDTNEERNCLSTPSDACPRFNISLTDSQMELILNTSQQVSHQK